MRGRNQVDLMNIVVPTNQRGSPRCKLIVGVRFGSCRVVEVIRCREIAWSDNDATHGHS